MLLRVAVTVHRRTDASVLSFPFVFPKAPSVNKCPAGTSHSAPAQRANTQCLKTLVFPPPEVSQVSECRSVAGSLFRAPEHSRGSQGCGQRRGTVVTAAMGWTGELSGNLNSGSHSGENTPEQPVHHLPSLPTSEFSCLSVYCFQPTAESDGRDPGTQPTWGHVNAPAGRQAQETLSGASSVSPASHLSSTASSKCLGLSMITSVSCSVVSKFLQPQGL